MKKEEKLMDAIGQIEEDLVPDLEKQAGKDANSSAAKALSAKGKKNRRVIWLSVTASVLAAALLLWVIYPYTFGKKKNEDLNGTSALGNISDGETTAGSPGSSSGETTYNGGPGQSTETTAADHSGDIIILQAHMMAEPKYRSRLTDPSTGYHEGYSDYLKTVLPVVMENEEKGNCVFSPLSLYIALGMTAEISGGNSRAQILDVLHQPDIETSRFRISSIWQANYCSDDRAKLILANSFWMNDDITYNQEVLDTLANDYYAASFSGDPTTEEYTKAYQAWINQQTDYLLEDQIKEWELDPMMIMNIVSTVNYEAKWMDEFTVDSEPGVFHSPVGDVSCNFMHNELIYEYQQHDEEGKIIDTQIYYEGDRFTAVILHTNRHGEVRFILPKEGISPEDLLSDESVYDYLSTRYFLLPDDYNWITDINGVNISMPMFDVTSKFDLKDDLKKLGVTDIFDIERSDFSPLTSEESYVNTAEQDTRVMVDQYGIKAVAATVIGDIGMGGSDNLVDFTLDRPFLFAVISDDGLPVFVGIINNPAQ